MAKLSLLAVALLLAATACGGSTSGAGGTGSPSADTAAYRAVWARDWAAINRAATPWNPADGKPGACDAGGSQTTCYATDRAVLIGLGNLIGDLRRGAVPGSYAKAHQAMIDALVQEIQGLENRSAGIEAKDDARFQKGVVALREAGAKLVTAYNLYPPADRPVPALFGTGRRFS